jgi:hypothetical protein
MTSLGGGSPLWRDDRGDLGLNADPALVVKEFARTRRNRMILATAVALLGFPIIMLPDLEAGGLGSGSAIYVLILSLAYYRILRSRKREKENLESFPAIAGALQEIELSPKNRPRVFGYYTVSRRWLVKSSLLTFDFVSTKDVCWAYGKSTKHYTNFIPTHTTHTIEAKLRSGKTLSGTKSKERGNQELELLRILAPWAFFGHSDELEHAWVKKRIDFVRAVDVRIAGYPIS